MKKVIVISLIFLSGSLSAQNYQNICSPGVTFFNDDFYYYGLFAFNRDSVAVMPNLDTVFYYIQPSGTHRVPASIFPTGPP